MTVATNKTTSLTVSFKPRRIAHVNMWVSHLEPSVTFYEDVLGLELVRRERELLIAFHTNGNSHHDIGIIEISRGQDRYGRDGQVQIPKTRGTSVGLNHLGWEMESEAELVAAIRRARALGIELKGTVDHLISHSAYLADPDGNNNEFYSDSLKDWRSIYHLGLEDEVTGAWDPLAKAPKEEKNYPVAPPINRIDKAPIHPSHLTGATLTTRKFNAMVEFYTDVAGLKLVGTSDEKRRVARLAAATGNVDLTIKEVSEGENVGLETFRFRLLEATNLEKAAAALKSLGADAKVVPALHEEARELLVRDPDGYGIVFHQTQY